MPVAEGAAMAIVVITCPNTGERVRGTINVEPNGRAVERFERVECLACWQSHYLSPTTGKMLGQGGALNQRL
jgi:hypothetical protein